MLECPENSSIGQGQGNASKLMDLLRLLGND